MLLVPFQTPSTHSPYALPVPTPSSAHLNAASAPPDPSILSSAKPHAHLALQVLHHPSSAPPATAHARRVLPAASAPLQARASRSCAMQAPTPPLMVQHSAHPALRVHVLQLLARLHSSRAPSVLPAPTVLQLRRSRVAAPSTRMPPCEAPAPAALVLGKLYPQRDRASA